MKKKIILFILIMINLISCKEKTVNIDDISFEINVKNGKLDGNTTVYYRGGQIQSERTYEKGGPINEAKYYYEDGQLQVFIDYKNKIKKTYYRDGALYAEMKFLGNNEWKSEGEATNYYENGKVKVIEIYEHGKFISKKEF